MIDLSLDGLTALVCGSTSGIGRACAEVMADQGARVILLARDPEKLATTVSDLARGADHAHEFLVADFLDPAGVEKVVTEALPRLGPFHVLVNNTGGPPGGPIVDAGPSEFQRAVASHLLCNHVLTQLLLPGMKAEGYGRIINIVSTSVRQPIPLLGVSNTTRAAVAAWSKTLSKEVARFGITVNCVLPGATKTARLASLMSARAEASGTTVEEEESKWLSQIPAGRFGEPYELGHAVAFLASRVSGYITGVSLPIDGGRIDCL
ncbi:MAG: SDR family oxidoreductase [Rhodothermales bacterium]|nr:SDR family oxidoreductase [Rhodothermales bacterium]